MTHKVGAAIIGVVVLALLISGVALAWPDEPPARATISGPGLPGEVEITDPQALAALKLGAIEDLKLGPVAQPAVSGRGYSITRYFYGGKFNFAHLRYYPGSAGQPGYLYWEDGPDLTGDRTPFDHTWLVATARGDSAMRNLLAHLGVRLPGTSANPLAQSAAAGPQPAQADPPSGATAKQPAQPLTDSPQQPGASAATLAPFRPEYLVVLAASLALGGMLVVRTRPKVRRVEAAEKPAEPAA